MPSTNTGIVTCSQPSWYVSYCGTCGWNMMMTCQPVNQSLWVARMIKFIEKMTQSLWVAGMIKFIEKKTKTRKQGKNPVSAR